MPSGFALCTLRLWAFHLFVCLAAPGLHCGTRHLGSSLRLAKSLVAAYKLLVAVCGSSSLTRGQTQPPTLGVWSLSHCTTMEVPRGSAFRGINIQCCYILSTTLHHNHCEMASFIHSHIVCSEITVSDIKLL